MIRLRVFKRLLNLCTCEKKLLGSPLRFESFMMTFKWWNTAVLTVRGVAYFEERARPKLWHFVYHYKSSTASPTGFAPSRKLNTQHFPFSLCAESVCHNNTKANTAKAEQKTNRGGAGATKNKNPIINQIHLYPSSVFLGICFVLSIYWLVISA